MSLKVECAEIVRTTVDGATLSAEATVNREYKPVYNLKDRTGILITIVPREVNVKPLTRTKDLHLVVVDVAVQKKLVTCDKAEIDPLDDLVEEIEALFRGKRFGGSPYPVIPTVGNSPIYDPEYLDHKRMFTSVIQVPLKFVRLR